MLRLGHRPERDKRISTHCALVARAFGADGIIFTVDDPVVREKVSDVVRRFGGKFEFRVERRWRVFIQNWISEGGEVIHLTMYGIPLPDVIKVIRSSNKDKLIVVGAAKVPKDVYEVATYNVSVTNQPHSEVAALAVFLDWLYEGREFRFTYKDAKIRIIPNPRGKTVIKLE